MATQKSLLIRVSDDAIEVRSSDEEATQKILKLVRASAIQCDVTIDKLRKERFVVCAHDGHISAIELASEIVEDLYNDGWSEHSPKRYVDGHWFHK